MLSSVVKIMNWQRNRGTKRRWRQNHRQGKILNVQIGKKLYRCTHRELDIYRRTHFSAFRPFFLFPLLDNQCVVRKLNVYDYGIRWTTQCDFSCLATEDLPIYLNTLQENLREILYHRFHIYLFLIKILYSINYVY